jgi:hypothetical protein
VSDERRERTTSTTAAATVMFQLNYLFVGFEVFTEMIMKIYIVCGYNAV